MPKAFALHVDFCYWRFVSWLKGYSFLTVNILSIGQRITSLQSPVWDILWLSLLIIIGLWVTNYCLLLNVQKVYKSLKVFSKRAVLWKAIVSSTSGTAYGVCYSYHMMTYSHNDASKTIKYGTFADCANVPCLPVQRMKGSLSDGNKKDNDCFEEYVTHPLTYVNNWYHSLYAFMGMFISVLNIINVLYGGTVDVECWSLSLMPCYDFIINHKSSLVAFVPPRLQELFTCPLIRSKWQSKCETYQQMDSGCCEQLCISAARNKQCIHFAGRCFRHAVLTLLQSFSDYLPTCPNNTQSVTKAIRDVSL